MPLLAARVCYRLPAELNSDRTRFSVPPMPNYQVLINGQNFLIDVDGRIERHGFFTVRFIEATDAAAAENQAVEMIREAEPLRELVRNTPDDPPIMDVTQIVELECLDGTEDQEPGFIWYKETPKRWWQFWKR